MSHDVTSFIKLASVSDPSVESVQVGIHTSNTQLLLPVKGWLDLPSHLCQCVFDCARSSYILTYGERRTSHCTCETKIGYKFDQEFQVDQL